MCLGECDSDTGPVREVNKKLSRPLELYLLGREAIAVLLKENATAADNHYRIQTTERPRRAGKREVGSTDTMGLGRRREFSWCGLSVGNQVCLLISGSALRQSFRLLFKKDKERRAANQLHKKLLTRSKTFVGGYVVTALITRTKKGAWGADVVFSAPWSQSERVLQEANGR